jgi:hypothetical protein
VSAEWSRLGGKSGFDALVLHLGREPGQGLEARAQPEPHHPDEAPALERAEVAELEVEGGWSSVRNSIDDPFDEGAIDAADESNCQVQIGGRRPAELGRGFGASGNKGGQ